MNNDEPLIECAKLNVAERLPVHFIVGYDLLNKCDAKIHALKNYMTLQTANQGEIKVNFLKMNDLENFKPAKSRHQPHHMQE